MTVTKVKKNAELPATVQKALGGYFGQSVQRKKALQMENLQLAQGIAALNSNIEHKQDGSMSGLDQLEEMFKEDATQERLSAFMHKEAEVNTMFTEASIGSEQKLEYTEVHLKYCEMLESILEGFLSRHTSVTRDGVLKELACIDNSNDILVCAPYISAGIDYRAFIDLVAQWKASYADEEEEEEEE